MHPILIDLGFFQLPAYGVLLATGVIAGLWTLRVRADRAGMDGAHLVDFALWLVIWALLGAKLLLVIVELPRYIAHPAELLGTVRAGGVFLGGFIAAVIAAVVLLRRYNLPALPSFDVIAPSLALGQAIGRIGCLMAGCCWGGHCGLPWAITYTNPIAAHNLGTPLNVPLHPFPIYASLFNFGLYLLLAELYKRRSAPGRVFATYLVLYGMGRILLELTRGDAARGFVFNGALSTSQLISLALIAIGVGLHVRVSRRAAA
ncbi:MAG: prolipoprotein diacylglyceryl transferase [Acidobacteria bacterium]|nr:prolipoprotein diacylglyceryl transferase [Candidatus Sulfomarinibacter sp. MAG AM2]